MNYSVKFKVGERVLVLMNSKKILDRFPNGQIATIQFHNQRLAERMYSLVFNDSGIHWYTKENNLRKIAKDNKLIRKLYPKGKLVKGYWAYEI